MSDSQKDLLRLGLSFAPTPSDPPNLEEGMEDYLERCRRTYGASCLNDWSAKLPDTIYSRIHQNLEKLINAPSINSRPNLSNDLSTALQDLRRNSNITVKMADKGNAIVVESTAKYISNSYEHLSDPDVYRCTPTDSTLSLTKRCNEFLVEHHAAGTIRDSLLQELTTPLDEVRTQRLYLLQKVHKAGVRPIVSSCGGPTARVSQFASDRLAPFLSNVEGLVKNSTDTIRNI